MALPRTGIACLALALLIGLFFGSSPRRPLRDLPLAAMPSPQETLLRGTPFGTPLYVLDGRRGADGPTLLVLAGVHGDEPGGPLAADLLVRSKPVAGVRLVIVPRANRLAVESGVRSTPQLGDLNRLYGASARSLPMTSMADAITGLIGRYQVDAVLDLHESWQTFSPASSALDTARIGQTVSADASEPSASMARRLVETVDKRLPRGRAFSYYEFPTDYVEKTIVPVPDDVDPASVSNKSGTYLAQLFPGVASLLVEVSQQQTLDDRVVADLVLVDSLAKELEQAPSPMAARR